MLQDGLSALELDQSQPVIYDRPIRLRLLYRDVDSGAEHYLIRYPPNLRAQRHRHSAAHTIILLEGVMQANGQLLHAGSYAHFESGSVHHHAPADGRGCLFVIIFHGPTWPMAIQVPYMPLDRHRPNRWSSSPGGGCGLTTTALRD